MRINPTPDGWRRRRACEGALILAVLAAALLGTTGRAWAQAQEFCLSTGPTDRFHLLVTSSTTTTAGTVLAVAGVHRSTVEGSDQRNPVTGTLMAESGGETAYRLALVETGAVAIANPVNRVWNARLAVIVGFAASNFLGPYTVDTLPAGTTLTGRGTGTMFLVNCQTGVVVNL